MLRRSFLLACGLSPLLSAREWTTPAAANSRAYSLGASADGEIYLLWIETRDGRHALRISRLQGTDWSTPLTVATGGEEWFVNAVDHPAVAGGTHGRVLVSWLVRPEQARAAKYGYGLVMAHSPDYGRSWKRVFEAGADNLNDYTGFVGFSTGLDGFQAAYLAPLAEGRAQRHAEHVKTLRFIDFSFEGERRSDSRLDADVCTCCPLAAAQTAKGPVAVYRDHLPGEIRDISIVRRVDGRWTDPQPVHRDGWRINGCPANGADIVADGERVAAAWLTAANDEPRVLLAWSGDSGATFRRPIRIDAGAPAGWTAAALLADGRAVVSWVERRPDEPGVGDLMLRIGGQAGALEDPIAVAEISSGRETGMPQMVRSGDRLVLAWRKDEQVRTAVMDASSLGA